MLRWEHTRTCVHSQEMESPSVNVFGAGGASATSRGRPSGSKSSKPWICLFFSNCRRAAKSTNGRQERKEKQREGRATCSEQGGAVPPHHPQILARADKSETLAADEERKYIYFKMGFFFAGFFLFYFLFLHALAWAECYVTNYIREQSRSGKEKKKKPTRCCFTDTAAKGWRL